MGAVEDNSLEPESLFEFDFFDDAAAASFLGENAIKTTAEDESKKPDTSKDEKNDDNLDTSDDNNIDFEDEEELDEEEDEKEKDKKDDTSKNKPESNSSQQKQDSIDLTEGYIEFLKESGLIELPEDFKITDKEAAVEEIHEHMVKQYKQSALNAVLAQMPEDIQQIALYAIKGGKDYKKFLENSFDEEDISTIENQTAVIKSYYKNYTKLSDEKIERIIKGLDEDELKSEAESLLQEIKDNKAAEIEAALKQKEKEEEANKKALAQYNAQLAESVKTAKYLSDERRRKIQNFMLNHTRKEDGMMTEMVRVFNLIQNNPEHFVQLADLLVDYDKEKGINYTRFERTARTTLNKGLKQKLEQAVNKKISSFGQPKQANNNDTQNWDWSEFSI